jgi:SAM-dependent methyltransferase
MPYSYFPDDRINIRNDSTVKRYLRLLRDIHELPQYLRDYRELRRQQKLSAVPFPFGKAYPILEDKASTAGAARGHYFHQDLLVARRIFAGAPRLHVDVGSRVDGFVAHVAAYREIEVFDVRPLKSTIPNVRFRQVDMMAPLDAALAGYSDSVSCLHALEHFGLGRYGDPVDYEGHLKGLCNLKEILSPGGKLYLSVPIGPQRIEFNAHRVFSLDSLLSLTAGFRVDAFSYVDDRGDLHENAALTPVAIAANFGCRYGCGILELTKR